MGTKMKQRCPRRFNLRHFVSKLCDISEKSYYVWKNKSHVNLIMLLEKYFSNQDLQEFLETGKISKLELIKNIDIEELATIIQNKELINKIIDIKSILEK